MTRPFIVAIDGPAGAGKSSVSKILALRLGFTLVDTGAIYRCVALKARRSGVALDDVAALATVLEGLKVTFKMVEDKNHVFLDGEDVSDAIRTPDISLAASQVSSQPVVRDALLGLQRKLALAAEHGSILEGRDIGTVVFPDAELKVFLFADPKIRAERRFEELYQKGAEKPVDQVLADQNKRDKDDSERAVAPLKPADDAVKVDSTHLPLSEVVHRIETLVGERRQQR
ncbi:MAG: (d)CMP kinase [Archangium gephyra]|uniref:Cytidylate kinase n=1 Tax=Archangium gephyra TaxID=48 RepID=A0A2W5THC0_9BACT|nr:MAG: (d)CMP kinase [Archangium gephyra]